MGFVFPPPVRAGDVIAVVAPSSPTPAGELWRGLAWLRDRYRLRATPRLFARAGYLAGGDAERAAELARALADPDVKAIVATRGGYGAMRTLSSDGRLAAALAERPRWLVGFSDVTALHAEAWAAGVASVHGPHAGRLWRSSPLERARFISSMERPRAPRRWDGLTVLHPGSATGAIVGGNLTLLFAMAAAGRLALPRGAVLALEDTGEAPYRLDRALTALRLGGHLDAISAVVAGTFDRCGPGPDGVTALDVLADRTASLGVPVVAGAPFGHEGVNEAFVLGATVTVRGESVAFWESPAGG